MNNQPSPALATEAIGHIPAEAGFAGTVNPERGYLRQQFPTAPERAAHLNVRQLRDMVGPHTFRNCLSELRSGKVVVGVLAQVDEYMGIVRGLKINPSDAELLARQAQLESTDAVQSLLEIASRIQAVSKRQELLGVERHALEVNIKCEADRRAVLGSIASKLATPEAGQAKALESIIEGHFTKTGERQQLPFSRRVIVELLWSRLGVELPDKVLVANVLPDGITYREVAIAAGEESEVAKGLLALARTRLQAVVAELKTLTDPEGDLHYRFEHGHLTFAQYREELAALAGSRRRLEPEIHAALDAMHEASAYKSNPRLDAAKAILSDVLRSRTADILLTFPNRQASPAELADHLLRISTTITRLIGSVVTSGWFERMDDDQLRQLSHEYLNLVLYPGYRVDLRVGYGGSNDPPNVRIPAYIAPPLELMRGFLKRGLTNLPRLTIVNGWPLSSEVNKSVDPQRAEQVSGQTGHLLGEFVRLFYPDCAGDVTYTEAHWPEADDEIMLEAQAITAGAFDGPALAAGGLAKAVQALSGRGQKHGGADGTQRYVAAHVQPDLFGGVQHSRNALDRPDAVVKLGGPGEGNFNIVQQYIIDRLYAGRLYADNGSSSIYFPNTAGGIITGRDAHGRGVIVPAPPLQPTIIMRFGGNPPPYYWATPNPEAGLTEVAAGPTNFQSMDELIAYYESAGFATNDLRILQATVGNAYINFLNSLQGLEVI